MREILTKGEIEKKETKNKVIIGLILIVIMALSTAGYAFFSGTAEKKSVIKYNGVEFALGENGLWLFATQGLSFSTRYTPEDTENISAPIFIAANNYAGTPLFFAGQGQAKQEIARNLGNIVLRMQDACIEGGENCEGNLPIKNCSANVIIVEDSEETKLSQENNCIFIEAPYDEQLRAADAFIFKILGIKS